MEKKILSIDSILLERKIKRTNGWKLKPGKFNQEIRCILTVKVIESWNRLSRDFYFFKSRDTYLEDML